MNLIRFLLTHLETKRTQKNIIFKTNSFHRCTTVLINSVNISSLVLLDFTSNWTFFQQCMHWAITPSVFAEVTAIDNHIRRNAHMKITPKGSEIFDTRSFEFSFVHQFVHISLSCRTQLQYKTFDNRWQSLRQWRIISICCILLLLLLLIIIIIHTAISLHSHTYLSLRFFETYSFFMEFCSKNSFSTNTNSFWHFSQDSVSCSTHIFIYTYI